MPVVRLFAAAREAAGTGRDELPGATVADVLTAATERYGAAFAAVLGTCRVWVNGDATTLDARVGPDDEVAVLPPVSGGADNGPAELPADVAALRARRHELQHEDDVISFVRRVAQGRADLARAEQRRRAGGGDIGPADITDELRDVLADRLLAGAGRPPRPAEEFSDDPRAVALDERCARLGFARLDELTDDELVALVGELDAEERRLSAERRDVFAELDGLTERLVEGYRDHYGGSDDADDEAESP